jgi:hypothetical protein
MTKILALQLPDELDRLINLLAKAGMKVNVEVVPDFIPQK